MFLLIVDCQSERHVTVFFSLKLANVEIMPRENNEYSMKFCLKLEIVETIFPKTG